jgi:ATP-binding cassette subfamily B (MDR/TAP) protein 1
VAQGGSFAEEVISTIRTAKAFGNQSRLGAVYDSHVAQSYIADVKGAMVTGVGISCFFFFVYGSYGLAFNFGTTLLLHGYGNVGTIINV